MASRDVDKRVSAHAEAIRNFSGESRAAKSGRFIKQKAEALIQASAFLNI
ncbi:hypothetical protein STFR1_90014 [Bacillus vallismortis]